VARVEDHQEESEDPESQVDPTKLLTVDVFDDGGTPLVCLIGELDMSCVPQLEADLEQVLLAEPPRIAFDLEALRFMDSSGIGLLIRTAARTDITLRHPSELIRRVIEMTGVSEILVIET
jgi:anti-sigma B factor antagonist